MSDNSPNLKLHIIAILLVAVGCLVGGGILLAIRGLDLTGIALIIGGLGGAYASYHGRYFLKR
jgi:hypothetical protein